MEKKLGFSIEILGAQSAVQAAEELRRKISEVQKEIKKATDPEEFKKLQAELVDLRAKQAEVTKEVREQVKARQQELAVNNKNASTYKELSDRLNALRARYKDMAAAEQDATQEARELRVEIGQLDRRLKQIDGDVGQFQRNVGDYTGALSQFFPRIGGAIGDISDSLGFLGEQSTLAGKGIGTIFLAIAGFDAVSSFFEAINEQIAETKQLQLEISNLTGQTGEVLQQGTAQAKAVAATYQQSATEIAVAANTVAKEFGISFTDALGIVEAGFRKGADAQGEFLDVVREYPAQFRDAGASAEEFLAVSIAASREGVYSDKGLDAVKEFGLRIREQTKATRDALTNALGPEFTQTLFDGLNNGSVNSVQALGRVTEALKENGVQGSELQTVIADVFGGPGEDVGQRFLFTLGEIVTATDDVTASTNKYQAQQEELLASNQLLAESETEIAELLFKTGNETTILSNTFKIFLNDVAKQFLVFFNELPATLKGAQSALVSVVKSFTSLTSFGLIGEVSNPFKAYNEAFKKEIRIIKEQDEQAIQEREETNQRLLKTEAGLTQRLQQLRQRRAGLEIGSAEFKEVDKQIADIEKRLRGASSTAGKSAGKVLGESFVEGSIAALQAEKSKYEKALENTIGEPAQRVLVDKIAAVEAEINKQVENINRLRAEAGRAQDRELFGRLFGGGTLPGVGLPDEVTQIRANEKAKTDEVFKAVQQRAAIRRKDIEKEQEEEKRRKEAVIAQIQDYTGAAFDILSAFSQRRNELENRRFEEAITQTETNIQQLEAKASQATGIRQRLLQKQVAQQQEVLKKQQADAEAARKKQAKEEKRIAIIQSIINGALAVQRALAVPPGPPFTIPSAISAGVFAAIQTATIAAQPLATGGIVGISGRRVTDRQNIRARSNGDNVLATVRRGEVVLNERQQSALGGARTFRAIGVPGFATGGAIGAPISAPAIPALAGAQGDFSSALAALDAKTDAINARIDRVKVFVVSEEVGRDLAEAGALRAAATL
jgi:murein DD-endopeptidase MepM/ murein hydrolase activator NlpD